MRSTLLEEHVAHGSPAFPVALYRVGFPDGMREILPCHWHDEWELLHLSRGEAVLRIDRKERRLLAGETLLIRNGALHAAQGATPDGCAYEALVFNPLFLSGGLNDICQQKYTGPMIGRQARPADCIIQDSPLCTEAADEFRRLVRAMTDQPPGYELAVKGGLFLLLSLFFREPDSSGGIHAGGGIQNDGSSRAPTGAFPTESATADCQDAVPASSGATAYHNGAMQDFNITTRPEIDSADGDSDERPDAVHASDIKKAIAYIAAHYPEKITLQQLADEAMADRYALCRLFRRYTGLSPMEFLNLHRVNEAAKLLQGGARVTDAALQTGFSNMSYFAKVFRRYRSMAPSEMG